MAFPYNIRSISSIQLCTVFSAHFSEIPFSAAIRFFHTNLQASNLLLSIFFSSFFFCFF
nr:MAG TPA: hypothetical protein [Caudoviricetes sp.]